MLLLQSPFRAKVGQQPSSSDVVQYPEPMQKVLQAGRRRTRSLVKEYVWKRMVMHIVLDILHDIHVYTSHKRLHDQHMHTVYIH